MRTITLSENPDSISNAVLASIDVLRAGGIIVAPTETTYGLVTNALNSEATLPLPAQFSISASPDLKDATRVISSATNEYFTSSR